MSSSEFCSNDWDVGSSDHFAILKVGTVATPGTDLAMFVAATPKTMFDFLFHQISAQVVVNELSLNLVVVGFSPQTLWPH